MAGKFFGRSQHSLDAKGRVILPARYRERFGAVAFASQHWDRCVALWPEDEFDEQLARMEAVQDHDAEDRNFVRLWAAGSAELEIDRQGRIAIPQFLREFAHLDSAVLVVGALNRVELWDPAEFERTVQPSEARLLQGRSLPNAAARPAPTGAPS